MQVTIYWEERRSCGCEVLRLIPEQPQLYPNWKHPYDRALRPCAVHLSGSVLEEVMDEDRDVDSGDVREAPWGEQQKEIDWLESRFDGPEEYEPSVYDGTYSEE